MDLLKIALGIGVAVVLAPLLILLAKRWRDYAAGFAAGSVLPPVFHAADADSTSGDGGDTSGDGGGSD